MPSLKHPLFSTFASSADEVRNAIAAGATHLILDDSKVSVRSFSNDFDTDTFDKYQDLAALAKSQSSTVALSVNIDLMMHEQDVPLVIEAIHSAKKAGISEFRVQDPGVMGLIQEQFPQAKVSLATETGNANLHSIQHFVELGVSRQCLTSELPKSDIHEIRSALPNTQFELHVQGPILLQYSRRRFMQGHTDIKGQTPSSEHPDLIRRLARDEEYQDRYFPFYENPHGHFMYYYFDRCLLKQLPDLIDLELDSWLFDLRGESEAYLKCALNTYSAEFDRYAQTSNEWHPNPDWWAELTEIAPRGLRSGFFNVNRTDTDWRDKQKTKTVETDILGIVVDTEKGKWIVVELYNRIENGQTVMLRTPRGDEISLEIDKLLDLNDNAIPSGNKFALVKLPWKKYVTAKTLVLPTKN